jgi:hypothetical protein
MSWNAAFVDLPDEFSFRHVAPTFYRDGRLLPPTFDSRLTGIPGFRVGVKWSISVTVTRTRSNPLSLLRRTTRCVDLRCLANPCPYLCGRPCRACRLSVPINYVPRTRPPLRGIFPVALSRNFPTQTPTSFVDLVPARREHTPPIHTQVTFSFPLIFWPFALTWPSFLRSTSHTRRLRL